MTNKRIAYTDEDGIVRVLKPESNARLLNFKDQQSGDVSASPAYTLAAFRDAATFADFLRTADPNVFAETEDEFVTRCLKRAVPESLRTTAVVVDANSLPNRDEFRAAWSIRGGKVEIDMERARDIYRAILRTERAPRLSSLDVEYQRADEVGDVDEKRRVVERKRNLRDMTKDRRIDAAKNVADLKTLLPAQMAAIA